MELLDCAAVDDTLEKTEENAFQVYHVELQIGENLEVARLKRETSFSGSTTWSVTQPPPSEIYGDDDELAQAAACEDLNGSKEQQQGEVAMKIETPECESPILIGPTQQSESEPKKMKNPWGNQSYANVIVQAIQSVPEKRLTLSEIYDWIVKNVPYFSDKAGSPSNCGWKVWRVFKNLDVLERVGDVINECL